MIPSVRALEFRFYVVPMRTRFPFQYGIASMTELPHLFVEAILEVNGQEITGRTSEGLPPKWFTKDPTTRFEEDLPEMLRSIRHAAAHALAMDRSPSFFEYGWALGQNQEAWALQEGIPGLLAHLGVALVERATLDGLCRAMGNSAPTILRRNLLGLRLDAIHPELSGLQCAELFPAAPPNRPWVRHTVGLGDPLDETDVPNDSRPDDRLPYTLVENIDVYGLRYFKIKLSGILEKDRARLAQLSPILSERVGGALRFSLDGNEQFADLETFRDHWDALHTIPEFGAILPGLLYVEQPIHRSHALDPELKQAFETWPEAPPILMDESDGAYDAFARGLELGYRGVSHKNCKGIVKSLANAGLAHRRHAMLSGEDLANVGPIALTQDTVMAAALGIDHMERNGHHYFKGLSMLPLSLQEATLVAHRDLYHRSDSGYPTLAISDGRLRIDSLLGAPFGYETPIDLESFPTLDAWLVQNDGPHSETS